MRSKSYLLTTLLITDFPDVGGGAVPNKTRHSLARISLRWMIRECFKTETGLEFKSEKLRNIGLDPSTLKQLSRTRSKSKRSGLQNHTLLSALEDLSHTSRNSKQLSEEDEDLRDVLSPIHDRLEEQKLWKLPEMVTGWHIAPGRLTGLPILK